MDTLRVRLAHRLRAFSVAVDLAVGRETFALVGPSGAGKTTVLRAIAGLLRPDTGAIEEATTWLDTERGIDLPPERRPVGLVFQDYALFPHLTVEQNVRYGARGRVDGLLERFGLRALARERPRALSGGERQRVALARALAREPSVLLLDEPLAALDAHTRASVRAELHEHLRREALPTILVTHDYGDAAALAARVGVLVDGVLAQVDTPEGLVAAPATPFVAEFTGANVVRGVARRVGALTAVALADGTVVFSTDAADGAVGAVVHPWEIAIARDAPADSTQNHLRGRIDSLVPVANRVRVKVGQLTAEITVDSARRLGLQEGDPVVASWKATGTRLVALQ